MKAARPGAEAPRAELPAALVRRRAAWLLVALVLAGLAAAGGWMAFTRWQQRDLARKAAEFLRKGDLLSACIAANRVLQKDPQNLPACRIAAQIAEIEHSPAAILWRQKIADLQPGADAPLIDLAVTATGFGETFIADSALAQVAEAQRKSPAWRQAATSLAIAESRHADAEALLNESLKLDPQNEAVHLSLAVIHLAMERPRDAVAAKETLERLAKKPQFRQDAMRALLADARKRGDSARALEIASELRTGPGAKLGDDLRYLDELHHAKRPELDAELEKLRAGGGARPEIIYALVTWMNARGLAAQSIQWCESLPAKVRAQMPVPLGEAEARTALADWKQLREIVRGADWADLEFLRLAIHARVLYETDGQRRRTEFHTMWESAKNSTRGNPNALMMLGRLVKGWGWKDEAAQAWWLAARNGTGNRAALKALFANYSAEKNTRELYRVARRVFEMEPANLIAKNNVAALALLIGEDVDEAHRLAAELYTQTPAQSVFASTHALSLCKQKRAAEAVAVLKKLPPAAFADPSIAACYGVALNDAGDAAAARPFLETADRAKAQLFPEEAAMVADALQRRP